jgi:hypothetical protein
MHFLNDPAEDEAILNERLRLKMLVRAGLYYRKGPRRFYVALEEL